MGATQPPQDPLLKVKCTKKEHSSQNRRLGQEEAAAISQDREALSTFGFLLTK